ncbi:MAG: HPr(Ser) kinase/phosphatase [Polynucleobacter sp.]|nr:HPr(Ser) kinase/phosphatase [Polynucleobacter sp.]MDZ4055859.1 HPr(Ser) kinase/phosphatase [Polynucleobacter sp.]
MLLEGLTALQIFDDNVAELKLSWIKGLEGADRKFPTEAVRAAAASSDLVGHLNLIHPSRIQIFGEQEVDYHADLTAEQRHAQIANLISKTPPCVIVADGRSADPELQLFCQRSSTPLFTTPVSAAEVIDHLRTYLTKIGAPQVTMHGVFMDILGLGVLITGESGLGKSELGLELISRGHGLVADDAVDFARLGPDYIEGRCPVILRDLLEVRGLGLLDIRTIFGETAVRRKLKLRLIVQLVRRNDGEFERLPIDAQFVDVLGAPIRTVKIQVAAGRNLAVLVEAAVRNTILQLRGIDTLKDFIERQRIQMSAEAEQSKNQGRLI